jgi:putative hydrolase of the HAD superfamily
VFLDVGNTVISMDYALLCELLAAAGMATTPTALARAEAAARPPLSRFLASGGSTEAGGARTFYLRTILAGLPGQDGDLDAAVAAMEAELRANVTTQRLWSNVLPGVPEALDALRGDGLTLVAVSNSDGTVEQGLRDTGLRPYFDAVVDSAVVGFEKPDPRIFRHALERVDARPERTVHVGDLYAADVVGARAAGLHALLLDPFGDWTDVDCDVVTDVGAVAAWIRDAARDGRPSRVAAPGRSR